MCSLQKEIKLHLLDIILKSVGSSVELMPPSHTSLPWPQLRFPSLIGTVCRLTRLPLRSLLNLYLNQILRPEDRALPEMVRGHLSPRKGASGTCYSRCLSRHSTCSRNKSEKKGMRSSVEADILMEQGHIPRGANIWLLRVNMLRKRGAKKGELGSRNVAVRLQISSRR